MSSVFSPPKSATLEEIAQHILQTHASDEAHPDESLGSYVVSLLQETVAGDRNDSTGESLAALDAIDQELKESLTELLQEHCLVEHDTAVQVLLEIFRSVCSYGSRVKGRTRSSQSPHADALSPTQAKTLIPNDLLGEIGGCGIESSCGRAMSRKDDLFRGDMSILPMGVTHSPANDSVKNRFAISDPGRSRESSLDETTTSNSTSSTGQHQAQHLATHVPHGYHSFEEQTQSWRSDHVNFYENTLESCVEYLLSLNAHLPLSRAAAIDAASAAESNAPTAQYLIDLALTAPPVCRHFLDKGCYRADCTYSHAKGVCLFWLKGSCRWRVSECQFLHSFDREMVQDVMATLEQVAMEGAYQENDEYSFDNTTDRVLPDDRVDETLSSRVSNKNNQPQSSFAVIASKGYHGSSFADRLPQTSQQHRPGIISTVPIPQDLWNPHENRDSSAFFISDPMERYLHVSKTVWRKDVIDLHFQSIKTFSTVLSKVLPAKLSEAGSVWIVTGTGHHVGSHTHQKGGGTLQVAVKDWLLEEGYKFCTGKDRNGQSGAILVMQ